MTASYEYDNLPDELLIDAIPEEFTEQAMEIFTKATAWDATKASEIKIAQIYDRKGYMEANALGGARNGSYSRENDDIIIQMTLRIDRSDFDDFKGTELEQLLIAKRTAAIEAREAAELRALEEAADNAAAALAAAQARMKNRG
jgi:hypothetical protein